MDKYSKVKKIGEGSFGKAFLVRHKQSSKSFVIKEINISKMNSKERQEARKEVAVLAQMAHPNVVAYRESFEEVGNLFIVMDFCDAGDLYSKINAQRGALFSEDQIMDWFVQICLALKHIHDRKILHRDIKSQNIFMTKAGIVKLGDFGIAKVLNSTVELARTCIGTPYYLSPEICENKPYNNKSDVWSLGCVLYELTTLKHAFEAGNMKNLVLKIIRGSYPPVPPKYSYDLRGLISLLFKRSARDRPSVNSILKKPYIQKRIQKFLSDTLLADEFSHTVMHGQKMQKQLGVNGAVRARPQPVMKKPPAPVPAVAAPKYNPAAVYGQPAAQKVRKSSESRKSDDGKKRPPSGGGRPLPVPAGGGGVAGALNQDFARKKQEMVEREKKRLELKKKEQQMYARQHRELIEKQRAQRMHKAREEGWKNMMGSINSDDSKEEKKDVSEKEGPRERGNYDNYNEYLDNLQRLKGQDKAAAVPPVGAGWPDKDAVSRQINQGGPPHAAQAAAQKAEVDRVLGAEAAERARVVQDYLERKQAAAINKQKGVANLFGNDRQPVAAAAPVAQKRPYPYPDGRNQDEKEYLDRLRQIRLQNFNDRRVQNKADPRYDAEARKKKIEALKAQADERAQQLKEQLERKRRQAFEREQNKVQQGQKRNVPMKRAIEDRPIRPAPVIPLTNVLNAIGAGPAQVAPPAGQQPPVGMTKVLKAIGAQSEGNPPDTDKPPIRKQKEDILKRLNNQSPPARAKWGQPAMEPMVQADRPKWGEGDADSLCNMALQETSSAMEATSAADLVVKNPLQNAPPAAGRKQWGKNPSNTALNFLQGAKVTDCATVTISKDNSKDQPDSSVTVNRAPIQKGTIIVDKPKTPNLEQISASHRTSSKPTTADSPSDSSIDKGLTTVISTASGQTEQKDKVSTQKEAVLVSKQHLALPCIPSEQCSSDSTSDSSTDKESTIAVSGSNHTLLVDKTSTVSASPNMAVVLPKPFIKQAWDVQVPSIAPVSAEVKSPTRKTRPKSPASKTPRKSTDSKADVSSQPDTVEAAGEGKLFDKVELVDDEEIKTNKDDMKLEDIESIESQVDKFLLKSAAVMIGLTVGHFDVADAQMLRTSSCPDLSNLFRTNLAENPFFDVSYSVDVAGEVDTIVDMDDVDDDNDDDDDENDENSSLATDEIIETPRSTEDVDEKDDNYEKDEDDNPSGDDTERTEEDVQEEEDLRHLRESMQNLLTGVKDRKSPKKSPQKTFTDSIDGGDIEVIDMSTDVSKSVVGTIIPVKEAWHSDEEGSDKEDGANSDDDMFCRLEESRFTLETELGEEAFLKAYKTVQAIHEDDNEVIEDGQKIVSQILGEKKEHLYTKILQLVMADGAYLEDND